MILGAKHLESRLKGCCDKSRIKSLVFRVLVFRVLVFRVFVFLFSFGTEGGLKLFGLIDVEGKCLW